MVFGEHGREQQVHVFIVVQFSVSPAWHLHSETLAKKCCKCLASPSLVLQRHFEVAFFNLHPQTAFGSLKSGDAFCKKIPDSQIGWESPNPLGFFSEKNSDFCCNQNSAFDPTLRQRRDVPSQAVGCSGASTRDRWWNHQWMGSRISKDGSVRGDLRLHPPQRLTNVP